MTVYHWYSARESHVLLFPATVKEYSGGGKKQFRKNIREKHAPLFPAAGEENSEEEKNEIFWIRFWKEKKMCVSSHRLLKKIQERKKQEYLGLNSGRRKNSPPFHSTPVKENPGKKHFRKNIREMLLSRWIEKQTIAPHFSAFLQSITFEGGPHANNYFWGWTMSKLTQQYVLPLFGDFYRRFLGPFQVVNRFGQTSCSCLFSWADVDTPKLWNNSTDSTSSTFHYLGRPMQNAHQVKLLSLCWLVACM